MVIRHEDNGFASRTNCFQQNSKFWGAILFFTRLKREIRNICFAYMKQQSALKTMIFLLKQKKFKSMTSRCQS